MTSPSPVPSPTHSVRPAVDVLVVDDRPEQLLALEAALSELEVTVFKATSGREALKLLLRRDFALILLDVNMPGMDGFELASLIRSRPRTAQTPIIFVTAASELETHVSRGYSLGAVDYIHVPVVPEILRTKVSVFVELFRKTEEIKRRAEELRDLESREHRRRLEEAMENLASEARQVELLREEHLQALRSQRLTAASLAINSTHTTADMLRVIAEQSAALLSADRAFVWIRDDGNPRVARAGGGPPKEGDGVVPSGFEPLLAAAAALAEPLRLSGQALEEHPALAERLGPLAPDARPSSWLSVPLAGRERTRLGVIAVCDRRDRRAFGADEEGLAQTLAESASLALQDLLLREAREANRIKDEFLAVLSHELRTPLSAMMGWTQLLRGGRLDEHNRERAVEIIERNLKIQTQLIDDLLDMSRIVTGKLRLDPTALVLPTLVSGSVDALRPAALGKGIRLEADLEMPPVCVWGDPGRLEQVAWNLLSNAIKFTPAGGEIEVRLHRSSTMAELSIRDDGEGIPAEMLPQIFDRFTQAKPDVSRVHGGLGLGLTIVKRLVELHGGSIHASSPGRGRGATFTVYLPVFDADVGGLIDARTADAGKPSLHGVRVLVVEDEPDAREMIGVAIGEAGATVFAVGSAAEAWIEFERRQPDLMVSDISMPGEDGCSLLRRIRARPREQGGAVPAIALTALADPRDRAATFDAGYQIHLAKPVDLRQLMLAAATLTRARAPQEQPGETVS